MAKSVDAKVFGSMINFQMVYENVIKVRGPYQGKDNRFRIMLIYNDKSSKIISYPRYIMEKHLGRYLEKDEQVDHIDGNPSNNDISNLQILKFKEHQKLDALRNEDIEVSCTYCEKKFIISGNKINDRNRKDRHQSGYFCSRTCSGKYGREIQMNLRNHIKIDKVQPSKYKVKSAQKETFEVEVG